MYGLSQGVATVRDARVRPQVPTEQILKSILLMLFSRLGSLHALEEHRPGGAWRRWLGGDLHSADTVGRVAALTIVGDVRALLRDHYARRRRKKTLQPPVAGVWPLVLDGHEATHSFLTSCSDCSQRVLHTQRDDRTQYYHRYVLALLLHREGVLLLDVEPQRPGEDEIAASRRLLERLLATCPRAFTLAMGDALYLDPRLTRLLEAHGKHFLAVLKNERRDLVVDTRSLFAQAEPTVRRTGPTVSQWWDMEGFTTWPQGAESVRVVRSVETTTVRRRRTGTDEECVSEWLWATDLPREVVSTSKLVALAHRRWSIENEGFNDLVNAWHANHVYKHALNAMVVFWLLLCLVRNLVEAFLSRNLKPSLRDRYTRGQWYAFIAAEFYERPRGPLHAHPP